MFGLFEIARQFDKMLTDAFNGPYMQSRQPQRRQFAFEFDDLDY